jgi:hypothetical protein
MPESKMILMLQQKWTGLGAEGVTLVIADGQLSVRRSKAVAPVLCCECSRPADDCLALRFET